MVFSVGTLLGRDFGIAQTGGLSNLLPEARRLLEERQPATDQPDGQLDEIRARAQREAAGDERLHLMRERAAAGSGVSTAIDQFCRNGGDPELDFETFSRLERDYCRRARTPLRQFGYGTFSVVPGGEVLANGAISPNYVLVSTAAGIWARAAA